jgi:hypothetical protein
MPLMVTAFEEIKRRYESLSMGKTLMEIWAKNSTLFGCFNTFFASSDVVLLVVNLEKFLELIVEHQDKGATSSTENVGQSSLEEGACALLFADLDPAVQCVLVHNVGLCASRLHHHASSDCVEWI